MTDWYGCLLCVYRDLAHCALVNRQWADATQTLLYRSIEIGVVHYCDREDKPSTKRKMKHGEPEDASIARLRLLTQSVRANPWLASQIRYLKLPRMAKQSATADLARIVSVLPNLWYVDLPDGLYQDQPSCMTLKNELFMRCPEIRRMTYRSGAEGTFSTLAPSKHWSHVKVLSLEGMAVDPSLIVTTAASLLHLRDLTLDNLPLVDDSLFTDDVGGMRLPPVHHLHLLNLTNISTKALAAYLQRTEVQEMLTHLTVLDSSIAPSEIHLLMAAAPHLETFHLSATVSKPLLSSQVPPLASGSLQRLTFEILDHDSLRNMAQPPAQSYYNYLCTSIAAGHLPGLRTLFALSDSIPMLLMPPPSAPFARDGSSTAPKLRHELRVHTKTIAENDWELTIISPPSVHNRRGSRTATRPISLYADPQINAAYAHRPKDSVMVSNGWGGFLAVPSHERRSSASKHDLDWMGT